MGIPLGGAQHTMAMLDFAWLHRPGEKLSPKAYRTERRSLDFVVVLQQGDQFVWKDFAFETNYDENMTDRESFAEVGPFAFECDQYSAASAGLLESLRG